MSSTGGGGGSVSPSAKTNRAGNKGEDAKKKRKPVVYNPRWKGYSYILITSLINLSSISNIREAESGGYQGEKGFSLAFGVFTFVFSFFVLLLDRGQLCAEKASYTKSFDGKCEGFVLVYLCLWWIVGVAYMTQVGGIAYKVRRIHNVLHDSYF